MRVVRNIKLVFMATGIVMLTVAGFLYLNTSKFVQGATRTQGRVIDLAASRSSDSTTYSPVVRFHAADGQEVEFQSSVSSNPPRYSRTGVVLLLSRLTNTKPSQTSVCTGASP